MTCGVHLTCGEVLLQLMVIGLSNGAIIALNAIGVTLVYGAVRTINFAYGDLFALTTVVITTIVSSLGLRLGMSSGLLIGGLGLALAAALIFGVLVNIGVERIAFRPFQSSARLAPLIATIGISFILYQAALIWRTLEPSFRQARHFSDANNVQDFPISRIPELLPQIDLTRAAGITLDVPFTLKDLLVIGLAALIAVLVTWFLGRTRAGRALRACAQDAEMAELCGIDRNRAIRLTFAIGGGLSGAAAFVFALYYNRPFTQHGAQSSLVAFAAAVLGGIGNPRGAFWSGLLLGVLASLSDYFLATQWTPVLVMGILIGLLLLRPTGLAGEDQGQDLAHSPALLVVAGRAWIADTVRKRWLVRALVAVGLAYPLIDQALGLHEQPVMTNMLLFAILALGLNILLGFAGMLDLGYAAIFAIGGYTAAVLTDLGGPLAGGAFGQVDFMIVLLASVALAGIFGAINGALTLRLRGDYLAIVTLAFGQIVPLILLNLGQWTGGAQGMAGLPPPRLLTYSLRTPVERYYLALAVLLIVAVGCQRLARSRLGRAWAALSVDEAAALSCGVPIRSKLSAFVLGGAVAGIAGALFAGIFSYVDSDQSDFAVTAMVLAMVIIGGAGSVRGVIIGALVVAGYNQFVISQLGVWLDQIGKASGGALGRLIAVFDLRGLSYLFFGLALYLTILLRSRQRAGNSVVAHGRAVPHETARPDPLGR